MYIWKEALGYPCFVTGLLCCVGYQELCNPRDRAVRTYSTKPGERSMSIPSVFTSKTTRFYATISTQRYSMTPNSTFKDRCYYNT
jgi:hypothetical protein